VNTIAIARGVAMSSRANFGFAVCPAAPVRDLASQRKAKVAKTLTNSAREYNSYLAPNGTVPRSLTARH